MVQVRTILSNVCHAFSALLASLRSGAFSCCHSWYLFLLSVLTDFGFFWVVTLIHVEILLKAQKNLGVVIEAVQTSVQNLTQTADAVQLAELSALQDPATVAAYHETTRLVLLLLFAMLSAWLIFQGIAWVLAHYIGRARNHAAQAHSESQLDHLAHTVAATPVSFRVFSFAWRFAMVTLFWFACLLSWLFVVGLANQHAGTALFPLFGPDTVTIAFVAGMLVLGYFAIASYVLPRPAILTGCMLAIRLRKLLLPVYIVSLISLWLGVWVSVLLVSVNAYLSFAWAVLVVLPMITLARVWVISHVTGA